MFRCYPCPVLYDFLIFHVHIQKSPLFWSTATQRPNGHKPNFAYVLVRSSNTVETQKNGHLITLKRLRGREKWTRTMARPSTAGSPGCGTGSQSGSSGDARSTPRRCTRSSICPCPAPMPAGVHGGAQGYWASSFARTHNTASQDCLTWRALPPLTRALPTS